MDGAGRVVLSNRSPSRAGRRYQAAGMVERYTAWHWWNADPVRRSAVPTAKALAAVRCPTLVLVGELDLPDFQVIAQRLAAEIPRATLHTIGGAGHMANMEAPDAVNERVLAHLRTCA